MNPRPLTRAAKAPPVDLQMARDLLCAVHARMLRWVTRQQTGIDRASFFSYFLFGAVRKSRIMSMSQQQVRAVLERTDSTLWADGRPLDEPGEEEAREGEPLVGYTPPDISRSKNLVSNLLVMSEVVAALARGDADKGLRRQSRSAG